VQAVAEDMLRYRAQKLIHDTEFDQLWSSHDEQLIGRIFKCHILAEYYLARFLEASNPSLGSLKAVRLSFDSIAILTPGLTELNRIRNRIEHRLSPNIDSVDLKGMRNLIEALEKATHSNDPAVPDGVELIEAFTRVACSTMGLLTAEIREVASQAGLLGWQSAISERLDRARR
jgi:hypothetical protein